MTKFTDTVTKFNSRLMTDLGISPEQAAGIWGNIGGETGGLTLLQETNPVVQGSAGGWGWLQWTGPRRRAMLKWCTDHNMDPSSDEANYQYLVYETVMLENKSLMQLRKTHTVAAATETFMLLNLRPGTPHLDARQRWAEKAYDPKTKPPVAVPEPVKPVAPEPRPTEPKQVVTDKNPVWNFLKGMFK